MEMILVTQKTYIKPMFWTKWLNDIVFINISAFTISVLRSDFFFFGFVQPE